MWLHWKQYWNLGTIQSTFSFFARVKLLRTSFSTSGCVYTRLTSSDIKPIFGFFSLLCLLFWNIWIHPFLVYYHETFQLLVNIIYWECFLQVLIPMKLLKFWKKNQSLYIAIFLPCVFFPSEYIVFQYEFNVKFCVITCLAVKGILH